MGKEFKPVTIYINSRIQRKYIIAINSDLYRINYLTTYLIYYI